MEFFPSIPRIYNALDQARGNVFVAEVRAWQITTPEELDRLLAIRITVFVDEQNVDPNNEIDASDYAATTRHVLATVDGWMLARRACSEKVWTRLCGPRCRA